MASLQERKRKGGRAYLIQFALNRERRSLFLDAKYDRDDAETIKLVVEKCVDAIETENNLDKRTLAWLENAPDDLRERFYACGLIVEEKDESITLEELFDAFLESKKGKKPSTQIAFNYAATKFFELVDGSTRLSDFQRADALNFVEALNRTSLSNVSRATIVSRVKTAFLWALDRELIAKSPFARISTGSLVNKSREFYVDMEMYEKLLAACNSTRDRALLALYRIGGLRYAEALCSRWRDVDFEKKRMTVWSPKTERIPGKDRRLIPLFPRLEAELRKLREERDDEDDELIFQIRYHTVYCLIAAALKRANVPVYPRIIQNLRSSASIDIFRKYGEIAENAWLGHTVAVAKQHYLHVVEEDFERATRE